MKIVVTQEDINKGTWRSPLFCPVARALNRALMTSVQVASSIVVIHYGSGFSTDKPLSRSATRFVHSFDANRPVKPFNFILDYEVA